MRAEELPANVMKWVNTPLGVGKLAGWKMVDGQIRALVRFDVTSLPRDLEVPTSLTVRHGERWVFYTFAPEMISNN